MSLFINDVSKIPNDHQMISTHKVMFKKISSGIYHKSHSIFKSKYQMFNNRNIGSYSGKDTRMDRYFMVMHGDSRIQKFLQSTILSI